VNIAAAEQAGWSSSVPKPKKMTPPARKANVVKVSGVAATSGLAGPGRAFNSRCSGLRGQEGSIMLVFRFLGVYDYE
jgi:hypothetical protein